MTEATNAIVKIEITESNEIVATYENGRRSCIGDVKSVKGGKMMLARRAKQFGLKVVSPTLATRD